MPPNIRSAVKPHTTININSELCELTVNIKVPKRLIREGNEAAVSIVGNTAKRSVEESILRKRLELGWVKEEV